MAVCGVHCCLCSGSTDPQLRKKSSKISRHLTIWEKMRTCPPTHTPTQVEWMKEEVWMEKERVERQGTTS